jgi:hypothetical protein
MRRTVLATVVCLLMVGACSASSAPTPIVIYVTPAPVATDVVLVTPTPTVAPTPWATLLVETLAPTPRPTPTPKPWHPSGYSLVDLGPFGGGVIAVKWIKPGALTCTYSGSTCWGLYVIPQDGCASSLYVEVSLEDRHWTAVGYSNDSVGAVRPGQRAKLLFDSFTDGAALATITDISCY